MIKEIMSSFGEEEQRLSELIEERIEEEYKEESPQMKANIYLGSILTIVAAAVRLKAPLVSALPWSKVEAKIGDMAVLSDPTTKENTVILINKSDIDKSMEEGLLKEMRRTGNFKLPLVRTIEDGSTAKHTSVADANEESSITYDKEPPLVEGDMVEHPEIAKEMNTPLSQEERDALDRHGVEY